MTFRYSDRCGVRACFLGMGLGVECARVFSVWGLVWNAHVLLGIVIGVECAPVFSVWGLVWNARVFSQYGVRCQMRV